MNVRPHMTLRTARRISVLIVAFAVSVIGFGWPFAVVAGSPLAGDALAPFVVGALLAVVVALVVAELSDGGMDARSIAMLGLLAGLGIGLRALGPATAGIEPTFVLVILAARVFGPGFGFTFGSVLIAASAVLTAGVGPWLPFQMLATAWLGLAVGLLPRAGAGGRGEARLLALLSIPLAIVYGAVLNLSFWPLSTVRAPGVSYVAGDSPAANLGRYAVFYVTTSLGWDLARGVFSVLILLLAGRSILATLRRAARRARFTEAAQTPVPQTSVSTKGGLTTS
jgi:energy-coupling factor transport system substrate-specific component